MNMPLHNNQELEKFLEAPKAGLVQLAGHHSVGGMRASIYNAMPVEREKTRRFHEKFEMDNK